MTAPSPELVEHIARAMMDADSRGGEWADSPDWWEAYAGMAHAALNAMAEVEAAKAP